MEVDKILHMNEGAGENSYANSSQFQKVVLEKAMPVAEESVRELYHALMPQCLMMADMGCSSGPNALLIVSEVIDVVNEECRRLNRHAPQFGVYLNDLPGTPRSFYGRVFPDQFLHFVHSSYSIHWLSQVPQGLVNEDGIALNKGNIYIAKTSPPEIQKAYYAQFESDFTMFLRSRAKEMVTDGRMVLTLIGSVPDSPEELLGSTLHNMVLEGLIEEDKLDRFNLPLYKPTTEEVRTLVEAEGSFALNRLQTFVVDWSYDTTTQSLKSQARSFAKTIRAVMESLLTSTFGKAIMNDVFLRFERMVKERMARERCENVNIIVSMTKR